MIYVLICIIVVLLIFINILVEDRKIAKNLNARYVDIIEKLQQKITELENSKGQWFQNKKNL